MMSILPPLFAEVVIPASSNIAPPSSFPSPRETATLPAFPRCRLSPVVNRTLPEVPLDPSMPILVPVTNCMLPLDP